MFYHEPATMPAEPEGNSEETEAPYDPKVRWVIPNRVDLVTFVGRDVFVIAHDIYIIFFNFKTNSELVYVANSPEAGDGVDAVSGHKTHTFAFAEKVKNGRIFVVNYPSFNIIAELKDSCVNRYKALCMMECELVAGFSGFPDYLVSVWNWRTQQRLLSVPTGVVRRNQIYMASRTHMLICECWGEGLIVWEVAQCFKKNLMMKRCKQEVSGWEVSEPPLVGVCWSSEGQLYAVDPQANLYSVLSDGIGMVTHLEWSEDLKGKSTPCICAFGAGFLIYGPDELLRSLKKGEKSWKVVWSYNPHDTVTRLASNATCDAAAAWTRTGLGYRLTGESEEKIDVELFTFKQRDITKVQLIAPDFKYVATMNDAGMLCIYEALTAKIVLVKYIRGHDISFEASPVDPVLAVFGEVGINYGVMLALIVEAGDTLDLRKVDSMCLTHQIVSKVAFSPTGREMVAAAMSAGHIFIFKLSVDYQLSLVRYSEIGRGLADCFLMRVGDAMRCFSLVLFSDKYAIGERIICINAETGKDNKFAGKMQGPYARLLPLAGSGARAAAVPHLAADLHVLHLSGEKGVTVSVKMGPVVPTGHSLRRYNASCTATSLLTYGSDGAVILRKPDGTHDYDLKLVVSHRYEAGVREAVIDGNGQYVVHVGGNGTAACAGLRAAPAPPAPPASAPAPGLFRRDLHELTIVGELDKNYLEIQEDKKVKEEAMDNKKAREDVARAFESVRERLVSLLEENLAERPLHRLSLAEFNLHHEHRKERVKQAEREREELRLKTEARMRAQDTVTKWIRERCWDTMLTPRVKLFAIFSHYQVENYAVLPTQRDLWPELQQTAALRALEAKGDRDLFRPWEDPKGNDPSVSHMQMSAKSSVSVKEFRKSVESRPPESPPSPCPSLPRDALAALAASRAHRHIDLPPAIIPQTMAFSFLQMNWLQHIVRLNVQNMRLWFNKQFDDLMNLKKREVGLVQERNARLRFIIDELNKLSDLRGSFHHLVIDIKDPEWRQEEQPHKLVKVDPEECSIAPYISPSQTAVAAADPGPEDDFRERALLDMMDGVLEKLWHEEIKKPIPMPPCMLEKDPEHFNEDDLRLVLDYEAKVKSRNEERDKYLKMLHAEYAKLSQVLNEGVVKFNQKVKEMWLTKLQVDSVIGQENLNLMRLRRTNLDRVEMAEKLETLRAEIAKYEEEVEMLQQELAEIQGQCEECQAAYDALATKDKHLEKTFKNHFPDLSPIIVDQCYKLFRKRPKWQQRSSTAAGALHELAAAALAQHSQQRPHTLHPDCLDYYKGLEQLDLISNMPPVMDEGLWATMIKLRRGKIENEIRMRAVGVELSQVEASRAGWQRGVQARRARLARLHGLVADHRGHVERTARNRTVQLVLPAGQVEIITTGHMEDFEDATLIPREDIDKINEVILKVGALKLRMMRKQMEFRKGILAKEWEHAQMKMKLRHMREELSSYQRLKIPKELQLYLKNKELGYTDEMDYVRMEKEMEASKAAVNKVLTDMIRRVEEVELKVNKVITLSSQLERLIASLNVQLSEKRLNEDPLEPVRIRRIFKRRMDTLVLRGKLIREVQGNHSSIVLLQTELELLRLKTFPTLASFRTFT